MVLLSHSMRMTVHRDRKILLFSGSGVVGAGDKKIKKKTVLFPIETVLSFRKRSVWKK